MKGSMRERRPGVWQLRVAAGKDSTGAYRTVHRTHHGNKTAARVALASLILEVQGMAVAQPGGPTSLGALIDAWLDHVEADRSPTTIAGYRVAKRRIPERLLARRPDRVTTVELDTLYRSLRTGGLAPSSVRQTHAVIRRALAQGVAWGYVPANAAATATAPTVRQREATMPTVEQVAALSEVAADVDPEVVLLIRVAAATGLRRGELAGMQWDDLAGDVLHVRRNLVSVEGAATVKAPKSWASRSLRVGRRTLAALEVARAEAVGPWCWSERGRPWHPDTLTARFERVRRAAVEAGHDVEAVRLHDLRHFHASQLLAAGIDPVAVGKRLGHRNVATTLTIYAHAIPARDQDAADAIEGVLDGPEPDDEDVSQPDPTGDV